MATNYSFLFRFGLSLNIVIDCFQLVYNFNSFVKDVENRKNSTSELRHYISTRVENILERRPQNLPDRLESYISFCDLCYIIRHSRDKVWHTYSLKGNSNSRDVIIKLTKDLTSFSCLATNSHPLNFFHLQTFKPGNTIWKRRLSTVGLLFKVSCFVTRQKIFSI